MFKRLSFSAAAAVSLAVSLAIPMIFPRSAGAKPFRNSYVSFDIPDKWACKPFKADWVCHSALIKKGEKKRAAILVTAKVAGAMDNLQTYRSFLNEPRTRLRKSAGGRSSVSKSMHSKQVFINSHPWVDSLHKASEIPFYFTRYLGTICCEKSPQKLGILVTYSAHEDEYTKYAGDFLKSINSLRVLNIKKAISEMEALGHADGMSGAGAYMEEILGGDDLDGEGGGGLGQLSPMQMGGLGAAGLGALSVLYFIRRLRSQKKGSSGSGGGKKARRRRRRKK